MMRPIVLAALTVLLAAADAAPRQLRPAAAIDLAGISLQDQCGETHDLGPESRGRIVMLFTVDQRLEAKRCDQALTRRLDPALPLLRVIDAREFSADERQTLIGRVAEAVGAGPERFLLDWSGAVRTRLAIGDTRFAFAGFAPSGSLAGAIDGVSEIATMTAVLGLVGRPADPPFAPEELARVRKGR